MTRLASQLLAYQAGIPMPATRVAIPASSAKEQADLPFAGPLSYRKGIAVLWRVRIKKVQMGLGLRI